MNGSPTGSTIGSCPSCGMPLDGLWGPCPVCGRVSEPQIAPPPTRRPAWAAWALVLGLVAAAASLAIDVQYLAVHLSRHGRYDAFALVPNWILVPIASVLLLAGGLAWVRPLVAARPRLRLAVWLAVLAYAGAACVGPNLLTDVEPVL